MTDSEMFAFSDVFKSLERVFPKRLEEHERSRMTGDYFRILRKYPLAAIQAGAETWMQRGKYFPKPAEWIDAIPKRNEQAVSNVPEIPPQKAEDYRRAELKRFEGQPCSCHECVESGVTERPTRFVPETDADDNAVVMRDGEKLVTPGVWIHGYALARYYKARADFYNKYRELMRRRGMPKEDVA